ncbi:MAG: DUF3489 domain-containing protein [Brevundimonas sp.]|nr:DUF3489 domain-containing protein [Brevundimonas sp.]
MTNYDTAKPAAKPARKMAREPKASQAAEPSPKRPSKSAAVLAMLQRPEGATLDQLVIAAGWLPHTARAALTGLKKKGHEITSDKPAGGVRTYRVTTGAEAAQ